MRRFLLKSFHFYETLNQIRNVTAWKSFETTNQKRRKWNWNWNNEAAILWNNQFIRIHPIQMLPSNLKWALKVRTWNDVWEMLELKAKQWSRNLLWRVDRVGECANRQRAARWLSRAGEALPDRGSFLAIRSWKFSIWNLLRLNRI